MRQNAGEDDLGALKDDDDDTVLAAGTFAQQPPLSENKGKKRQLFVVSFGFEIDVFVP